MALGDVVKEWVEAYEHRDCCASCRHIRYRWRNDVGFWRAVAFVALCLGVTIGYLLP